MKSLLICLALCLTLISGVHTHSRSRVSAKTKPIGYCATGGAPIYDAGLTANDEQAILNIQNEYRS
jgi:hypothetical protein